MTQDFSLSCPIPISEYDRVLLAHGGGGSLSNRLIGDMFVKHFDNDLLNQAHDGAVFKIGNQKLAFTTDSYVVQPIFFPGGDIGDLAVNGTVNDLVCCGAKALYISVGFIIEEGFPMEDLWRVVQSMKSAADKAGVQIVTGDTKVVDKGKGDKIFINTAGSGQVYEGLSVAPQNCRPGDLILINGFVADHGVTIMSSRAGLEFETHMQSDSAALNGLLEDMLAVSRNLHVLRDPTRGGIASATNEIAASAHVGIKLFENQIPVREEVKGACEMLGLDPLYIANEGKILVFVPGKEADAVLKAMQNNPMGKESAIIGEVSENNQGLVSIETTLGSTRILDMISGEQLPRIC